MFTVRVVSVRNTLLPVKQINNVLNYTPTVTPLLLHLCYYTPVATPLLIHHCYYYTPATAATTPLLLLLLHPCYCCYYTPTAATTPLLLLHPC